VETTERALTSVLAQGQPPVGLLVIDGGSTDGTIDIVRKYESSIAHWRSYRDGNATVALNEGVERATGDVIALLPADDWIEPGGLGIVKNAFSADPDLDVVSCGTRIVHFERGGNLVVDAEFLAPKDLEFDMYGILRLPLTCGRFIRRRVYRRVGGHNPEYCMSNDLDFLIRVCLSRPKTKVVPQLVYSYRRHPASRTLGGGPDSIMDTSRGNISVSAHHLEYSPLMPDERSELRRLHGRSSARLAWILIARGRIHESMMTLLQTVRHNWLWPVQIIYWFGCYLLNSKRYPNLNNSNHQSYR